MDWLLHLQTFHMLKVLKGYQEFPDLAKASGFEAGEFSEELAKLAKQAEEANNIQP